MKIGFSLLSHQNVGSMMPALLNRLNEYPDKEIVIHHDFFQSDFDETLISHIPYQLVKNYIRTYWSHTNNVHAILETFKMLYEKKCDWYITLSANCYPLKQPQYVIDFLSKSQHDGYIEFNNVLSNYMDFYKYFRRGFNTRYLFKFPFLSLDGKLKYKYLRYNRRPEEIILNESFAPYHGSDWFIINRKTMEYILSNQDKVEEIITFLIDVNKGPDINICPPEIVFQTILGNSQGLNLKNENFRFIDWTDSVDWHPNILTMDNWEDIKKSEALFARKFNWEKSSKLIGEIDRHLLNIP